MSAAGSRPGRWLWPITATVSLLGLGAELAESALHPSEDLIELFSLSYEGNLPTWYASVLLFSCGATLAAEAASIRRRGPDPQAPGWAPWAALAALFFYASLDEAVEIHEHAAFFDTHGALYFSWVIPAAVVVAVVGLSFLPFLRRLPASTRRRFVLAGILYVGGALGMELPLGWWTERYGDDNLGYGLIDWAEESLELAGASYFLLALWAHREREEDAP